MNIEKLRTLRIPKLDNLTVRYSPHTAPFSAETEALSIPYNPQSLQTKDWLRRQPPGNLRWKFVTSVSTKQLPLSVQRNRLKRRWNAAFMKALKDRGFEHDGKRPATTPCAPRTEGLKGTLEVFVHGASGFDAPTLLLQQQASIIVQALEFRTAQTRP